MGAIPPRQLRDELQRVVRQTSGKSIKSSMLIVLLAALRGVYHSRDIGADLSVFSESTHELGARDHHSSNGYKICIPNG
jgi:hypothetical protein